MAKELKFYPCWLSSVPGGRPSAWQDLAVPYGGNFVVQRPLMQHSSLTSIHPASIKTIRVATLRLDEPKSSSRSFVAAAPDARRQPTGVMKAQVGQRGRLDLLCPCSCGDAGWRRAVDMGNVSLDHLIKRAFWPATLAIGSPATATSSSPGVHGDEVEMLWPRRSLEPTDFGSAL